MTEISILVPTLNRAGILERTLESVIRQEFPPSRYEIIVIDNGSTDLTADVVRRVAAANRSHKLRYVYESYPGLLAGRHRGFREAKGDVLVYIDDDIEAPRIWLKTIAECFADEGVAMVGGSIRPKYEAKPPRWLESMWESTRHGRQLGYLSLYEGGTEAGWMDARTIWGCNFPVRRSTVIQAGGFGPEVYPQKVLMKFLGDCEVRVTRAVERLSLKAKYHPGASVFHLVPAARMSVEYFCRKAYTDGIRASYSDIRNAGGLRGVRTLTPSTTIRSRLGDLAEGILGQLRVTSGWLARRKIWRSYRAGYAYHRHEAEGDPKLLAWILQEHYWDCQLPVVVPKAGQ